MRTPQGCNYAPALISVGGGKLHAVDETLTLISNPRQWPDDRARTAGLQLCAGADLGWRAQAARHGWQGGCAQAHGRHDGGGQGRRQKGERH